jgi:hypothetical protein
MCAEIFWVIMCVNVELQADDSEISLASIIKQIFHFLSRFQKQFPLNTQKVIPNFWDWCCHLVKNYLWTYWPQSPLK